MTVKPSPLTGAGDQVHGAEAAAPMLTLPHTQCDSDVSVVPRDRTIVRIIANAAVLDSPPSVQEIHR